MSAQSRSSQVNTHMLTLATQRNINMEEIGLINCIELLLNLKVIIKSG
jgi:hypothetical protein